MLGKLPGIVLGGAIMAAVGNDGWHPMIRVHFAPSQSRMEAVLQPCILYLPNDRLSSAKAFEAAHGTKGQGRRRESTLRRFRMPVIERDGVFSACGRLFFRKHLCQDNKTV